MSRLVQFYQQPWLIDLRHCVSAATHVSLACTLAAACFRKMREAVFELAYCVSTRWLENEDGKRDISAMAGRAGLPLRPPRASRARQGSGLGDGAPRRPDIAGGARRIASGPRSARCASRLRGTRPRVVRVARSDTGLNTIVNPPPTGGTSFWLNGFCDKASFPLLALSAIPNPRPECSLLDQQRTTVWFSLWPFCPLTKSGPYG